MKKIVLIFICTSMAACAGKPTFTEPRTPAAAKGTGQIGSSEDSDPRVFVIETTKGSGKGILKETCVDNGGAVTKNKDKSHTQIVCSGGKYNNYEIGTYLDSDCGRRFEEAKYQYDREVAVGGNEDGFFSKAVISLQACQNYSRNEGFSSVVKLIEAAARACSHNSSQRGQTWLAICYLKSAEASHYILSPKE